MSERVFSRRVQPSTLATPVTSGGRLVAGTFRPSFSEDTSCKQFWRLCATILLFDIFDMLAVHFCVLLVVCENFAPYAALCAMYTFCRFTGMLASYVCVFCRLRVDSCYPFCDFEIHVFEPTYVSVFYVSLLCVGTTVCGLVFTSHFLRIFERAQWRGH